MKNIWINDWILWDEEVTSEIIAQNAHDIHPAKRGKQYSYMIEHFGRVTEMNADGSIIIRDEKGVQHLISKDDDHIKRASWLKRKMAPVRQRRRSVIWRK